MQVKRLLTEGADVVKIVGLPVPGLEPTKRLESVLRRMVEDDEISKGRLIFDAPNPKVMGLSVRLSAHADCGGALHPDRIFGKENFRNIDMTYACRCSPG